MMVRRLGLSRKGSFLTDHWLAIMLGMIVLILMVFILYPYVQKVLASSDAISACESVRQGTCSCEFAIAGNDQPGAVVCPKGMTGTPDESCPLLASCEDTTEFAKRLAEADKKLDDEKDVLKEAGTKYDSLPSNLKNKILGKYYGLCCVESS